MKTILLAILVLIIFILLAKLVVRIHRYCKLFKYDERNPARRFCTKCGQQQNQYIRDGGPNNTWWETTGRILKPECECHTYQEYHR